MANNTTRGITMKGVVGKILLRIILPIFLIAVGIVGHHFYNVLTVRQPDTHIVLQSGNDEFIVTIQNRGSAPDDLVLTIGTEGFISSSNYRVIGTNVTPIRGAIPGHVGGNFVTFRIKELLPNYQSVAIIMTNAGDTFRDVEAWSDYTGSLPYSGQIHIERGPAETNPDLGN